MDRRDGQHRGWPQGAGQQREIWPNRWAAGLALAQQLTAWRNRAADTTVIGLPRGGIAVGAAVAQQLNLPLASWSVRKLALPQQPEYALGAIAAGGAVVWNTAALRQVAMAPQSKQQLIDAESPELSRRQQRFGDPPGSALRGRQLIVVDDGIATGMTVLAALDSLHQLAPAALVLAVPVLDRELVASLEARVDSLVAVQVVDGLQAVGAYYDDFGQLSDDDVLALLQAAQRSRQNKHHQRQCAGDAVL
ncbi:MAG: phosphoribosyltransferase family protein [Cyanobacteriota bacterium]|nr:phosphoribosyltransferase family protein [Cyanobacteriota bacterium]